MTQFVTRIHHTRRASDAEPARDAFAGVVASTARAHRRRLARLLTPAPDTLRARVRRELRAAAAATTTRSE